MLYKYIFDPINTNDFVHNAIMDLKCDHCEKEFNTNAGLYTHKQRFHKTPSVVLVKHNHSATSKRKRADDTSNDYSGYRMKKLKNKHHTDDEGDEGLEIVDEYNDSDDAEHDADMEIIDEYDNEEDGSANILSDEDSEVNLPLPPATLNPSRAKLNYEALYIKCVRNYKKMKRKFENRRRLLVSKHKADLKKHFDELITKRDEEIADIKERFKKQIINLEQTKNIELADRIKGIQSQNQTVIEEINTEHASKLTDLENECKERIRVLQDHIMDLQREDGEFTSLSKAIFSCTTIEEISEIQRLIKNHQLDVVVQKHLKTLQNLFLSLSYGIIPLCDSQRVAITDSQRGLVEKVQSSSSVTAKRVLKESRNEVINLFTIINDSLKLVRNSYNRYGNLDRS